MNELGNNIKCLRIKNGLNQSELANKLHTTYSTVSKWESGKRLPDIIMLKEISLLFSVSINELLGYEYVDTSNNLKLLLTITICFFMKTIIILLMIILFTHNM